MPPITVSIEINRPVKTVFDYFVHLLDRPAAGGVANYTPAKVRELGRVVIEPPNTIITIEADRRIESRRRAGPPLRIEETFALSASGTIVTVTFDWQPAGEIATAVAQSAGKIQRKLLEDLKQAKAGIECLQAED